MVKELLAFVDDGIIRLIDVLILTKNADGSVEATELSDVDELGEPERIEGQPRNCSPRTTLRTLRLR